MKNSSWTGRAPRTLDAAFGCGTSRRFTNDEQDPGYSWLWWAAMVAVCVVGLYFVVTGVPA